MSEYLKVRHPAGDFKARVIKENGNQLEVEVFGAIFSFSKKDCTPFDFLGK